MFDRAEHARLGEQARARFLVLAIIWKEQLEGVVTPREPVLGLVHGANSAAADLAFEHVSLVDERAHEPLGRSRHGSQRRWRRLDVVVVGHQDRRMVSVTVAMQAPASSYVRSSK